MIRLDHKVVLIAGATPQAAANGERFLEHLEASEVPLVGVVVNRMRLWPSASRPTPA